MGIDFNYGRFVGDFESHLRSMGFYLKKAFDDSPKGDRFYKDGFNKNKAFGRYKYVPPHLSKSGDALIIWTQFDLTDKAGNSISHQDTQYFWYKGDEAGSKVSQGKKVDPAIWEAEQKKRIEQEVERQRQLRIQAKEEYETLIDAGAKVEQHPYLLRKKIIPSRGLIIASQALKIGSVYNEGKAESAKTYYHVWKGDLIIPAMNLDFDFVTYQKIDSKGNKRQRIDISTKGAFHCIGKLNKNLKRIFLCEGYATGIALHKATNAVVLVCFDVDNVGGVLALLKVYVPDCLIVIATDNDRSKPHKVGIYKGLEYCAKSGMPFIFPRFPDQAPLTDSDWDDLSRWCNPKEINKIVSSQLAYFKQMGIKHCILTYAKHHGISQDDLRAFSKDQTFFEPFLDDIA